MKQQILNAVTKKVVSRFLPFIVWLTLKLHVVLYCSKIVGGELDVFFYFYFRMFYRTSLAFYFRKYIFQNKGGNI